MCECGLALHTSAVYPCRVYFVMCRYRLGRGCHSTGVGFLVPYSHVASIFLRTPINVPFSSAAATLSLSPSCLLTASSVLWVPFLMRTSIRKRGGKACSSRTRTPKPMTVASEQCVMVGVISTTTVLMEDCGETGGRMRMSGRLTTASEPSDSGCSGSEMVEMRSVTLQSAYRSPSCPDM
jgi:hypothetical protein